MSKGYVSPEKLEQEADDFIKASQQPPAAPEQAAAAEVEEELAPTPTGEDPPAPVTDPPASEAEPAAEPEPKASDFAGLTLEQIEQRLANIRANAETRIKGFQALMTKATQQAADARRASEALAERVKSLTAEMEKMKATPPAPAADQVDDADIAGLEAEYPALAPVFKQLKSLKADLAAANASLTAKVQEVSSTVTANAELTAAEKQKAIEDAHFAAINEAHSDASDIAASADFQGWLSRQSSMYQYAIEKGTAIDVIDVLTKYKKDVGIPLQTSEPTPPTDGDAETDPEPNAAPKETKLEMARRLATPTPRKGLKPPTNPRPSFSRKQIAAMSPQEFAENEAAIDEAMAHGRITP
jgi:hypothetical protein